MRKACREGKSADRLAKDKLAKYKTTMNAKGTSGTYAPSSLLYYHFSRYFDTVVDVPVSVWRSMDRREHYDRVVRTGLDVSSSGGSPMNRSGWEILAKGAEDPSTYRPTSELYTDDGGQIFGILLESDGRRYGAEINGTRRSGWGAGQNRDLQETAPFLALRYAGTLSDAIAYGVATASKDPDLRKAMTVEPSSLQMTFWMTELSEVVLLDFIFSQQDRVGNIDYRDFWYWVANGQVERRSATTSKPPADIATHKPVKVRRSIINDNDAGGRIPYANFAKTTGMIENLRHFRGSTYTRLQRLAADFKRSGPMYEWLSTSFGISERQVTQVVKNTVESAGILRDACVAGRLQFSLDPLAVIAGEVIDDSHVPCDAR